jgi:hypothetical protein
LNNPGVVVPPVPEKSPFGRFDENFVEQRRSALEKCINKMANHPVLMKDGDLKMFLESDTFALDVSNEHLILADDPAHFWPIRSSKGKQRLPTSVVESWPPWVRASQAHDFTRLMRYLRAHHADCIVLK